MYQKCQKDCGDERIDENLVTMMKKFALIIAQ
jgi:hypothetical protein